MAHHACPSPHYLHATPTIVRHALPANTLDGAHGLIWRVSWAGGLRTCTQLSSSFSYCTQRPPMYMCVPCARAAGFGRLPMFPRSCLCAWTLDRARPRRRALKRVCPGLPMVQGLAARMQWPRPLVRYPDNTAAAPSHPILILPVIGDTGRWHGQGWWGLAGASKREASAHEQAPPTNQRTTQAHHPAAATATSSPETQAAM